MSEAITESRAHREAENGYSESSATAVSLELWRERQKDEEFEALCKRLYHRQYMRKRRENPEEKAADRERARRYGQLKRAANPEAQKRWRLERRAEIMRRTVFSCAYCEVVWSPVPGTQQKLKGPKYCSIACRSALYYHGAPLAPVRLVGCAACAAVEAPRKYCSDRCRDRRQTKARRKAARGTLKKCRHCGVEWCLLRPESVPRAFCSTRCKSAFFYHQERAAA